MEQQRPKKSQLLTQRLALSEDEYLEKIARSQFDFIVIMLSYVACSCSCFQDYNLFVFNKIQGFQKTHSSDILRF